MSAVDSMMASFLKAFGLNPEQVKAEFITRIQQFETNIHLLNSTLIGIKQDQQLAHQKLDAIIAHLGIEFTATKTEVANVIDGRIVSLPSSVNESGGSAGNKNTGT